MPPAALQSHPDLTPAQLKGAEKDTFFRHVEEYLVCFRDREVRVNRAVPLSCLMSENWQSGRYWFYTALSNLYNCDYPFWDYVFLGIYEGRSESSIIEEVSTADPAIEAFVERKLRDLDQYNKYDP